MFFFSTENGSLEILKYLLDQGVRCQTDNEGKTNLMQAARSGNLAIVEYFLQNLIFLDVDLNAQDKHGENVLFYGVRSRSMTVVEMLLSSGVVITNNDHGINVLSQCLAEGMDEVVDVIMNSKVDFTDAINGKDVRGRSLLYHYVDKRSLDMLEKLGEYYDSETDQDVKGTSLLMRACMYPTHLEVVKYLVEVMKVNLSAKDHKGRTALFYAADAMNGCAVELLLEHVPCTEGDNNGVTPLMIAASHGDTGVVDLILNAKFLSHAQESRDTWGQSAAHYASLQGRDMVLEMLLANNWPPDAQDSDGVTPLMCACAQGNAGCVTSLLRHGSAANIVDAHLKNALHYCFGKNASLRCVRTLIKYEMNINKRDDCGQTPLMLACRACANTHIPCIKALLDSGADPILQDNEGKDSFDFAPFDAGYVRAMMNAKSGKCIKN